MPRRLLVALLAAAMTSGLALALLWAIAGNAASAQEPERKNCPAGFHWERMSGICCVQDYETLPSNGKIGYVGDSLCNDGYVGIYDHRQTTNGEGVDGCPDYTSFAFLEQCLTPAEYERFRQQESSGGAATGSGTLGGDGAIRDASEALYGGGGGPSNGDLATAGAVTGAIGAAAAGAALRGRPGSGAANAHTKELTDRLARLDREYSDAAQALEKAHEQRESLERERKVLEALAGAFQSQQARLDDMIARIEAYRGSLATSRWLFAISAALAGLAGLLAAPALIAQIGVVASLGLEAQAMRLTALSIRNAALRLCASLAAAMAGAMRGIQSDVWKDIRDGFAAAKARTAELQGQIRGELNRIPREYEEATRRQDEARARVDEIRSQQVQVYEELQRARGGG